MAKKYRLIEEKKKFSTLLELFYFENKIVISFYYYLGGTLLAERPEVTNLIGYANVNVVESLMAAREI